jgi:hypothetical protein
MARFSSAMVAFGDPRQEVPFVIDCPLAGQGRWLDDRQWVYDLNQDAAAASRCIFTLRPGLTTLAGQGLSGEQRFSFDTGGPAIRAFMPATSQQIEEEQVFILLANGPLLTASLTDRLFFEIEGVAERVPAVFLQGPIREQLLTELRSHPQAQEWEFSREDTDEAKKEVTLHAAAIVEQLLLIKSQRPLPPGKEATLVWDAGIAAPNGLATSAPQRLTYTVEPLANATVGCERTSEQADCVPITDIHLNFGSDIPRSWAEQVRLQAGDGRCWRPTGLDGEQSVERITFSAPFPEQSALAIHLPQGLVDHRGRPLANANRFPIQFHTSPYPPLVKFPAAFGIFERLAEPMLPVALRNVEASLQALILTPSAATPSATPAAAQAVPGQRLTISEDQEIILWLKRLRQHPAYGYESSLFTGEQKARPFTVPKTGNGKAFELVGIPLTPGFHILELASPRLGATLFGRPGVYHVNTAALVTNLAVHLKWGDESSLVWVTALDSGQPVAKARVRVSDMESGELLWQGESGVDGLAKAPAGVLRAKLAKPQGWERRELLVTARSDDDLSFALSSWNDGIAPYEFGIDAEFYRAYQEHTAGAANWREAWGYDPFHIGHTIFDRPLFRGGETVHMKHLLRQGVEQGFARAVDEQEFTTLTITHQGSGQVTELPLAFHQGSAVNEWPIPQAAKLGRYLVAFKTAAGQTVASGAFTVAEFRVPTMRGEIHLPADGALINPTATPVDVAVHYLAGGPAKGQAVTLRLQATERSPSFADYPDFTFGGGEVREGVVDTGGDQNQDEAAAGAVSQALVTSATLDQAGSARTTVNGLPQKAVPQTLVAELEYRDANGETLTVADRIPIWPAAVVLGFKDHETFSGQQEFRFPVLAVDTQGHPLAGQAVTVELFKEEYHSSRKRLLGGFYAYDHQEEVTRVATLCQGATDSHGLLLCQGKRPGAGSYLLRASSRDAAGNLGVARASAFIPGNDGWRGAVSDSDRMDLVPNQRQYAPGDLARCTATLPFREATALVTVEREGVLDAFVTPLSAAQPVVELPIRGNYGPNVYVSVLAVRGRIAAPTATALVDLAKPAFRLGYCRINVGWQGYELKVKVTSPKEVYHPREQAEVRIAARQADGSPLPPGTEVAVAAVDEGLLELMPNRSWNLLASMMQPRQLRVDTATAQLQVVGKRHFGRKAIPSGGGGGRQPARELFDTLLLWSPQVALDARGEAVLQVPLNDALTSFRIAAVASSAGAFGSGTLSIRASQEVMLHSGLPPLVRNGDRFQAMVTVRNGGDRPLDLTLSGTMTPHLNASPGDQQTLASQQLHLAPGAAQEMGWTMVAPPGCDRLQWTITSQEAPPPGAQAPGASDTLKVVQEIADPQPVHPSERTLHLLAKPLELPVALPATAVADKGGLAVEFIPSLASGLGAMREYMRHYPYSCLEQRVSTAVALDDRAAWEKIMAELPPYLDADGLLRLFPAEDALGSPVMSAYLLNISQEARFAIPQPLQQELLAGLGHFVEGKIERGSWLTNAPDLTLRKLMALEALSRYDQAARPEMLTFPVKATELPMASLIDWINILRRMPGIANQGPRLEQALALVRSRLYASGSTITLPVTDSAWWLFSSPDTTAVRAVLAIVDEEGWQQEAPRFMLGTINQQRAGRWDTTMANAWGRLLADRFRHRFGEGAPQGESRATLAGRTQTLNWQAPGGPLEFPWPAKPATLRLEHQGPGAPWVAVTSRVATRATGERSNGYTIARTLTPVVQAHPGQWSRGDVARVHLDLSAQTAMGWVVVADPIPTGATIIGQGLTRDSALLAQGEEQAGLAPAFTEAGHQGFRAYYQYVPTGPWSVEYTVRFNSSGDFRLPPTRVEAMYVPELYAEQGNPVLTIGESRP